MEQREKVIAFESIARVTETKDALINFIYACVEGHDISNPLADLDIELEHYTESRFNTIVVSLYIDEDELVSYESEDGDSGYIDELSVEDLECIARELAYFV